MVGCHIAPERAAARMSRGGCTVLFISGAPGVGCTSVALNVGIGLSRHGIRTILIDANAPAREINRSPRVRPHPAGRFGIEEALLLGPYGLRVLSAARDLAPDPRASGPALPALAAAVVLLRLFCDVLLVESGTAPAGGQAALAAHADRVVLVTTPAAAHLAASYIALKVALTFGRGAEAGVVVNAAANVADADQRFERLATTVRRFLGRELADLGFVPFDSHVAAAAGRHTPVTVASPDCPRCRQ